MNAIEQAAKMTDAEIAEIAERFEALNPTDPFWIEFARAIESRALSSAAPQEPVAYMMKHVTGTDIGLAWRADDAQFDQFWKRIPLYAAPAQPQEQPVAAQQQDERAAFEKWSESIGWPRLSMGLLPNGRYRHPGLQDAWEVWQARAAHPVQAPQQDKCFCDKSAPYSCTPCWNEIQAPQQEAGQARELPPLPEFGINTAAHHGPRIKGFTAEQMQEYARAAQSAPAVPDEREAWMPYLSDCADGVKGHYAVARWNPDGYREVWNLRSHRWASTSEDVLTLDQARELMRNLTIPPASAPAVPTVPEGFALVPRKATEGMIRAAFGWRQSDSRAGLIGDADMYERIYYAMISAALASSPDVPGEWERLLTQVIPYRLKLIERGECVDASVEAIRECVARLLASAPAQPKLSTCRHCGFRVALNEAPQEEAPAQPTVPEDVAKDAARYRWLVENSFDVVGRPQFHVWLHTWEPHSETGEPTEWKRRVDGPAIDRRVDELMNKAAIAAAAPVAQGSKEE